jgi:hypothetical protein
LDRLLLLLDTGSSTPVRTTAAKQLAQLAAKSVISDVVEDDNIKASRPQQQSVVADPSAWSDLMAVIARVSACAAFHLVDVNLSHEMNTTDPTIFAFKVL